MMYSQRLRCQILLGTVLAMPKTQSTFLNSASWANVQSRELRCVEVDWRSHCMLSGSLGSDLKLWRLDESHAVKTVTGSCALAAKKLICIHLHSFARNCLAEILKPRDLSCKVVVGFHFGLDCETTAGSGGIGCVSVNWKMHNAICGCGNLLEVSRGHRLQLRLLDNHLIFWQQPSSAIWYFKCSEREIFHRDTKRGNSSNYFSEVSMKNRWRLLPECCSLLLPIPCNSQSCLGWNLEEK